MRLLLNDKFKLSLPLMILVGLFVFSTQMQGMGMMSIFDGEPTANECRLCHGDNEKTPHPLLQVVNADRHHSRVGDPIEGLANGRHDTVAPGDISSGEYKCLSCHSIDSDNRPTLITDCLTCHPVSTVTGNPHRGNNVHHSTNAFYNRQCHSCHGFLSSGGSKGGSKMGGRSMRSGMGMRGKGR